MPHLIVIEGHEGQRRQLEEQIAALEGKGYSLTGKFEAGPAFNDWKGLFESAGARGLFAERQLTVSDSSEALGPFPDELAPFLEGDDADSAVIATFSGDSKKIFSKAMLALKKIAFIRAPADVPPWKRKDWLLGLAREKGFKLAPDAAALLGESIESLEELRSELDKLAVCAGGEVIGLSLVQELSFDQGGRAHLAFLDGVCQARPRDVARSLRYLRRDPVLPHLASLCNRLRPALYIAAFPRAQGEALKAIGMGSGKDYALRMARSALSAFGPAAVKNFMLRAARLSFLEKTSLAEGWPGFELILWDLMGSARDGRAGRGPA